MKRVEVTFTNKDGLEETQQGRLISYFYEGYAYLVCYIVLDDGRVVAHTYVAEVGFTKFVELTESHDDDFEESPTIKIIENS